MRFLILAVAFAFTASPALGQFRPELPQWTEQANASIQTRFGLMYDLDWDVPQNDAEGVRWKPILIGAGIGLTLGFAIGEEKDNPHAPVPLWTSVPPGWTACVGMGGRHIGITGRHHRNTHPN